MKLVRSAWGWLRRQVVEDVPADDALCEFDCRKPECSVGEWENCDRRLQKAAGELMPAQKPASDQAPEQSIEIKRGRA
jgi:hypothetical protein